MLRRNNFILQCNISCYKLHMSLSCFNFWSLTRNRCDASCPVEQGAVTALRRRSGASRARRLGFADASKCVNLALQGGGAHGAFTWGVLDQLLADGRVAIDSISGASAGAVNAVMLADGLARGGPEEARQRLADFWRAASFGGGLPELQREALERLFAFVPRQSSPVPWLGALSRYWSPYDLNPLNINPLKDLIERFVDFEAVRGDTRPRAVHLRDQCAHRRAARVLARRRSPPSRDGVGLPAAAVPGGRDRRRALLGRRLQRQSGGAAVPARDLDRGRADRADQSARARRRADLRARYHDRGCTRSPSTRRCWPNCARSSSPNG